MNYFNKYLEQAKKYGFVPDAAREIVRYLIVNGHIPASDGNLAIMGDREFHLSAEHIPERFKEQALKHYEQFPDDGEYDEEHEIEHIRKEGHSLDSARFCNGQMVEFKMNVIRVVKVETSYDYRENVGIEDEE